MAIRIKNERVHAMAKELAAMTGQTQVAAITQALEEELARVHATKEKSAGGQTTAEVDRKSPERS